MTDLSGRKQLTRNVIVTWIAHIFILIAGFVLPRQISDNLGAEALGIWDLGWATVRYLSLTSLGFGSSLTRYSALYQAKDDKLGLSKAYTAVFVWQALVATIIIAVSYLFSWSLNHWIEFKSVEQLSEAKSVLFLLGISIAIKMLGSPAAGLISGCHRWDIQNSLTAGRDFLLALVLIAIMLLGGSLVDLAWATVISAVIVNLLRHYIARRLVPDARFSLSLWNKKIAIKMLSFGTKSELRTAQTIIIFQTIAILLAGSVGPAALAIFNRGAALVRHARVVVTKITVMFMPMTSGLLGLGDHTEAKQQLIKAGCYSFCITLPISIGIFWLGDLFILIWMGPEYVNQKMIQLLAVGSTLPIAQSGTMSVLAGLNAHGKVTLFNIFITIVSLVLGVILVNQLGWSVITAAALTGVSWTIGSSISILYYLRRLFHIPYITYIWGSTLVPIMCNIPLFGGLWLGKLALLDNNWAISATAMAIGAAITLIIYWYVVLNKETRSIIARKIRSVRTGN